MLTECPSIYQHFWKYEILYADPPWPMYGDPNKMAAAGKHYSLMTLEEIQSLPVKRLLRREEGCIFLWATCPRLDIAIDTLRSWGFYYRGVSYIWVKTRLDGKVIHGQGIPPTATKPTTELCLLGTTQKVGRPYPLADAAARQVYDIEEPETILAPRGRHSEKPDAIRDSISRLYGDRFKLELFARKQSDGWYTWGNQC